MLAAFYVAAAIALLSTGMVITRRHPIHALLYLVISLLAVAVVFYVLGAPYVAALEVIIYAGAIMVLFVFVMMLLNLGASAGRREELWLEPLTWLGPSLLAFALAVEVAWLVTTTPTGVGTIYVSPTDVAKALYGPYLLGVEIASMLLIGGLVGAYHVGRRLGGRT